MLLELAHHIGGARRPAPPALEQRNPARLSELVCLMPDADPALAAEASLAAARALDRITAAGIEARADALHWIAEELFARREALGLLIARETGKTITDAGGEVVRAARIFRFFAGEALRIAGEQFESVRPGVRVEVRYDPVGVVGVITPWNFPIAIPAWKIAPALAFGNAVAWKPSEHASATAAALMDLIAGSGLPHGAVNMLLGARGAGEALVAQGDLAALSFTGSEAAGRAVTAAAAARGLRVQAEMGGVNGLIVLADADLDLAADGFVNGAFFAAGQRCTATSRLIVEASAVEPLLFRIRERTQALLIGDPCDPATQVGPLVSPTQKARLLSATAAIAGKGLSVLAGGWTVDRPECFVDPVLYGPAQGDLAETQEEIFGPVSTLIPAGSYEAALDILNSGRFGLCGGIYTRALATAEDFKRRARVGMAMVNLPTAGVDYHAPFGGLRASSYGPREQGRAAREFYTVTRTAYQAAPRD